MPSIISLLSSLTLPAVFEHKPWNIMLIGSRMQQECSQLSENIMPYIARVIK